MNRNPLEAFDRLVNEFGGDLAKTTIGMNRIFDGARNALGAYDSYPPYNFEQTSETNYRITYALAGFSKEDITVTVKENWLYIEGEKKDNFDGVSKKDPLGFKPFFHHRGIATRAFKRAFQLASDIVVTEATMENGLLHIELEQLVPEEQQPKLIQIK